MNKLTFVEDEQGCITGAQITGPGESIVLAPKEAIALLMGGDLSDSLFEIDLASVEIIGRDPDRASVIQVTVGFEERGE